MANVWLCIFKLWQTFGSTFLKGGKGGKGRKGGKGGKISLAPSFLKVEYYN
jgi:hypothetical protein